MKRRFGLIVIPAMALLSSSVVAGPIGSPYHVVRSGSTAQMGFHYSLDSDCRSRGPVSINLVEPPRSGKILIGHRRAHPSFPVGSAFALCNRRNVDGTEVYYRPDPGYLGQDHYVVERVFPNGNAQLFGIDVVVR